MIGPHTNLMPTHTELIIAPEISAAPPAPIINKEAELIKTELLAMASEIKEITTPHIRDAAIQIAGQIKGHISQVERDRKAIKDPFYRMGLAIDSAAKKHVAELENRLNEVNRLIGAFNAEQEMIVQREQEARDREAQRIQREAAEALRQAAVDAELLRTEQHILAVKQQRAQDRAEASGKGLTAKARAEQLQAQLDADERADAIEAKLKDAQEASDRLLRLVQSEKLAAFERFQRERATGGAQHTHIEIEITNIHLLYTHNPNLVRLEPDLTQIKYQINGSKDPNLRIPGITWAKRAVFQAKAL